MKCDEGYDCDVCGQPVEAITESDLYLSYVLGEVPLESLHLRPERHIRCNPVQAQFIVAEGFEPVKCDGPFSKANLDAEYVAGEEKRITAAWLRLQAIPRLGIPITDYPLAKS